MDRLQLYKQVKGGKMTVRQAAIAAHGGNNFGTGFARGTYVCDACGKRTRDTGNDEGMVGLCRECYDAMQQENGYADTDPGDAE